MSDVKRSLEQIRRQIEAWFAAGLLAVDPYEATRSALAFAPGKVTIQGNDLPVSDVARVVGIAFGKAAADMARALDDAADGRLTERILLTKDGHLDRAPAGWQVREASHPVPDDRGVSATREMLEVLHSLGPDDLVIALVSGGGSALLEAPRSPLDLADIQAVTSLLLKAGAPIQDLNAVRSELSDVKGGGLRRAMGKARCVSLILSDVLGNDPTVIASGPTVYRKPNPERAMALLESYGLTESVPAAVIDCLRQPALDATVVDAAGDIYDIVGDNDILIQAMVDAATSDGHAVRVVWTRAEGEARDVAARFLDLANGAPEDVDVVIGGGEATVTVRGTGNGGRNTEFALEAALQLTAEDRKWVVASLASDGQDGSIDAAGAIVDPETIARGEAAGLSASKRLEDNDSGGYFATLGELVETGPTGTNVNDVYVAVRLR